MSDKKEYIERAAAIAAYCEDCTEHSDENPFACSACTEVHNIMKIPAADVAEVRHGEWLVKNNEKDWKDKKAYRLSIECSECGKTHFLGTTKYQNEYGKEKLKALGTYADYSYCGRCGAKMDGKGEG